jgi:DNA-binding response OmpR family regulator
LGIATSSILDLGAREVIAGSKRASLTRREFDTPYYRSGDVVERDDILNDVWGHEADVASNVVDVTIRSLRKKLRERSSLIETIFDIGYRVSKDHAI